MLEAVLCEVAGQRVLEGAFPNDVQANVRLVPFGKGKGIQQQKEPLILHQAADNDDVGLFGDGLRRKRVEVQGNEKAARGS